MKEIILILLIISFVYSDEYYFDNGKKVYLKELKSKIKRQHNASVGGKEIIKVKYYTTKNGTVLGVNNDILVKCKRNINCKQELLKYDVEKVEEIAKHYYLLHLEDNAKIFALSREIYEKSFIELSHPDFEITRSAY